MTNIHILLVRQCLQKMIGQSNTLRGDGLANRVSKKTKLSISEVASIFSKMKEEGELVCDDWHRNLPLSKVTVCIEPEPISAYDKLWISAMEVSGFNAVEVDSLLAAAEILSDFNLEDLKRIANGLKKIKSDQDKLKGQSRFIVSATYLLGSSKILDSLPEQAIKKFGIKLEKLTKSPSYVISAGPPNPEKVILVENPQAMETALNANIPNVAWVATYGYGLSMVGDDYGRQLASIVESSNRSVHQLIRSGTPPPLDVLFSNENIYFWGDLDPEGLKIFRRLKSKLPNLELSSLYQPMLSYLQESERHHPYIKSTGKEGQKTWDTSDLKINNLLYFCSERGVDQEVLTANEISLYA